MGGGASADCPDPALLSLKEGFAAPGNLDSKNKKSTTKCTKKIFFGIITVNCKSRMHLPIYLPLR